MSNAIAPRKSIIHSNTVLLPYLSPTPLTHHHLHTPSITHTQERLPNLHAQTPPHPISHRLLKLAPPLPPHLRRLDVGRTLVVGLGQHAHDADENLLHALDGTPALRGLFVVVGVVAGGVQDGDADEAGRVDCGAEETADTLAFSALFCCLFKYSTVPTPQAYHPPVKTPQKHTTKPPPKHPTPQHSQTLPNKQTNNHNPPLPYTYIPFGCHTSPTNRIVGGLSG